MPPAGSRNSKEQRRDNAYRVLNIIRQSRADVSRKVLNEETGLSFPSVNDIVNYLQDFRLISSFEGEGSSGKKVPCYRFSAEGYALLGLTVYPGRAVGVCTDPEGRLLREFFVPFEGDVSLFFSEVLANLEELKAYSREENRRLLALGIGCPGLIDYGERRIIYCDQFPQLENQDFVDRFEEALGLPCFMDHNPNLSAFAAGTVGSARDLKDFIYVILDKGVGGSLFHGGRLFRGTSSFIGELGHSSIVGDGAPCGCGNRGCLEAYAAADAIDRALEGCPSEEERDSILQDIAEKIGLAVGNLICFLGIGNVVFGGLSLSRHPGLYYKVRQVLLSRTLPVFRPALEIRKSELDEKDSPMGAALWAGEIALSNLSSRFFGEAAPDLPLKTDHVMKGALRE